MEYSPESVCVDSSLYNQLHSVPELGYSVTDAILFQSVDKFVVCKILIDRNVHQLLQGQT